MTSTTSRLLSLLIIAMGITMSQEHPLGGGIQVALGVLRFVFDPYERRKGKG